MKTYRDAKNRAGNFLKGEFRWSVSFEKFGVWPSLTIEHSGKSNSSGACHLLFCAAVSLRQTVRL